MRRLLLALLVILLLLPVASGQFSGGSTVILIVRVNYDDARSQATAVRVQLTSESGITVAEGYLDSSNQWRHAVPPGYYRLRFTSMDIHTHETPAFTVSSNTRNHTEMVSLRLLQPNAESGQSSAQGSISLAEIGVPDKARKEFEKGSRAMEAGNHAAAEKHFQSAVRLYADYGMAYNNLGVLALRVNDTGRGRVSFEEAAKRGSIEGSVNLARLVSADGKNAQAEALLDKVLAIQPQHAEALLLIAKEQLIQGKLELALSNARRVHEVPHPSLASCHLLAARVLESQNLPAEALAEYRLYLAEAPHSASAERVSKSIAALEARVGPKP